VRGQRLQLLSHQRPACINTTAAVKLLIFTKLIPAKSFSLCHAGCRFSLHM
jgi:hypothetical protein